MATLVLNQWVNVGSYTVYPGGGASITFWIDAKLTGQDKAENKSYIDTRLNTTVYGSAGGAGYGFWVTGGNWITGDDVYWYSDTTVCTGSFEVQHNSDGTKTTTISASAYNRNRGFDISFDGEAVIPKIDRYPVLTSGTNFTDRTNPVYTITAYGTYPIRVKLEAGGDTNLITRDLTSKDSQTYTLELTKQERKTLKDLSPDGETLNVVETVCAMSGSTELSASYKNYVMTITSRPFKLRVNGEFVDAIPYVRVNNEWKEADAYIRVNNEWKEGI